MRNYKDSDFINSIIRSINEKNLVLFLGAGFSKLCGLPLWNELAYKLIDVAAEEKGVRFNQSDKAKLLSCVNDPRELVSIAFNYMKSAGKETDFYNALRKFLTVDEAAEKPATKRCRLALRRFIRNTDATVITTNSDTLIDDLFDEDAIVIGQKNIQSFSYNPDKPQIVHLHGSVKDYASLIFTTSQYLSFYQDNLIRMAIDGIFAQSPKSTILFIGYGFSELQLLDFMIKPSADSSQPQNRFALDGFYSYQDNVFEAEDQYYRAYGLRLISYSKDRLSYLGLLPALKYIFNKSEPSTDLPSRAFIDGENIVRAPGDAMAGKKLRRNLLKLSKKARLGLLDEAGKSNYSDYWIPFLMKDNSTRSLFSLSLLKPAKRVGNGLEGVDCPAIRIISTSFEKNKSPILRDISKKILISVFAKFRKHPELFTNFSVLWQLQQWIFDDVSFADMQASIDFVARYAEVSNAGDNWLTWSTFRTNVLDFVSKEAALSYCGLAIKNGQKEGFDCYEYERFLNLYSDEFAKKYSKEVALICLEYFKSNLKNPHFSYDESRDPFWKIKETAAEDKMDHFNNLTAFWLIRAIDYMSELEINGFYSSLSDTNYFSRNLKTYIWSAHFQTFRNAFNNYLGKPFSDRRLFSELFGLISRRASELSAAEFKNVLLWINEMKISNRGDLFNKVCQIYLLKPMIMAEERNSGITSGPAAQLDNKIKSTLKPEEAREVNRFPEPRNISKNFWMGESSSFSLSDTKKENELLSLSNEEFLLRLGKAESGSADGYTFESVTSRFFEQHHLYEWLVQNDYLNFGLYPSSQYLLLISHLFDDSTPLSLSECVAFSKKCLLKVGNQSRQQIITEMMKGIYYSLDKKYGRSRDGYQQAYDFAKEILKKETIDWKNEQGQSFDSYQSLLFAEPFFILGTMTKAVAMDGFHELEEIFEDLFSKETAAHISKAALAAHVGYFWVLDSPWVRAKLNTIFANDIKGRNYSFLGFSISLYYGQGFIDALFDTGLLPSLLNSKDFESFGYYYGYYILRSYFGNECKSETAIEVLRSAVGISALHMTNEYLSKLSTDSFALLDSKVGFIMDELIANGIGGGRQTGSIISQLIALHSKTCAKTKIIEAICRLAKKWHNVSADAIRQSISKSDLNNEEKIKIIASLIDNVDDGYLFLDELIALINAADWSTNMPLFNQIRNHLGELNPTALSKVKCPDKTA